MLPDEKFGINTYGTVTSLTFNLITGTTGW